MKTNSTRTTTIVVNGENWIVPFGFGTYYRELAEDPAEPEVLSDLLSLVGYDAWASDIETVSLRMRVEAEAYACRVHLWAGDNIVRVPAKPEWMPDAWQGAPVGEGVFQSPGGTPLWRAEEQA